METDLSPLGIILRADPVVKGVVVLLVVASIGSWAVILDKTLRLTLARRQVKVLLQRAQDPECRAKADIAGVLIRAGLRAREDADANESRADRRERIERAMRTALAEEVRRLETGLPFLATVGSTAPFIGLFGTVWGIMHSFTSIAQTENTSLAVVAPGIAEALFATALGLAVAIPAVVASNRLSTSLSRTTRRLTGVIATIGEGLSRQTGSVRPALQG